MNITAEQIAELLGRAEKHNTRSSVAGSATLIWDLAEAVKALSVGPDRMITDSNEAQREIDDLTAQVEALAAERDDLRAKLAAAEAERDEADRRAGAAERRSADRIAELEDDAQRRSSWLYKAKMAAGYYDNTSFDVVWAEALAALKEKRAALKATVKP